MKRVLAFLVFASCLLSFNNMATTSKDSGAAHITLPTITRIIERPVYVQTAPPAPPTLTDAMTETQLKRFEIETFTHVDIEPQIAGNLTTLQQELSAAVTRQARSSMRLAAAREELAQVTEERDELQKNYENLKTRCTNVRKLCEGALALSPHNRS
ncbi:MAG: coiled-coil domain-containing protein [Holosporaceae bacterium]|jgi:hypothetical protein|nr:coiled-coil domain-containing protein [Holosporaceae bacterium]